MRILVLGAGGMAGHVIALRLQEKGHIVTGFARRTTPFCETVIGDVCDRAAVGDVLHAGRFDAVVNAVGILPQGMTAGQSLCDGIWINSGFPHFLAEAVKQSGGRVIHLSTDCVFSGHDAGGYTEGSFRSADDYYGRSKALGEVDDSWNLTFRTSIIGPDVNKNGVGLFNWFMKQRGEVNGFRQAIWTGVTTVTLADAIHEALEQKLTGLYHLVNNAVINKFDLITLFNGLRREPVHIVPVDDYVVDKSLVDTRRDFRFPVPSYAAMVYGMGEWIANHGELYRHYGASCRLGNEFLLNALENGAR